MGVPKVQHFVTFHQLAVMINAESSGGQPRVGIPKPTARQLPFPNQHGRQEIETMFKNLVRRLWCEQEGQDIAEYAVMLAVILVIVVGTVRLIGSNANNVFSNVASSIQ